MYPNDENQTVYRCTSGCVDGLNRQSSEFQTIIQKQIQRTVRIPCSLYTMNLSALSTYQAPSTTYVPIQATGSLYLAPPSVNWNQISDRAVPHSQPIVNYGNANSYKRSKLRLRPGAMSVGGTGVDIKHGSYDRYLNRLKGKSSLKKGTTKPSLSPSTDKYYGNKQYKEAISSCIC